MRRRMHTISWLPNWLLSSIVAMTNRSYSLSNLILFEGGKEVSLASCPCSSCVAWLILRCNPSNCSLSQSEIHNFCMAEIRMVLSLVNKLSVYRFLDFVLSQQTESCWNPLRLEHLINIQLIQQLWNAVALLHDLDLRQVYGIMNLWKSSTMLFPISLFSVAGWICRLIGSGAFLYL